MRSSSIFSLNYCGPFSIGGGGSMTHAGSTVFISVHTNVSLDLIDPSGFVFLLKGSFVTLEDYFCLFFDILG